MVETMDTYFVYNLQCTCDDNWLSRYKRNDEQIALVLNVQSIQNICNNLSID